MAFTTLPQALIAVGKPIIKSIFQSLKDNQDDLNTRTLSIEAATNKIVFFDGQIINSATYASATGLIFHRIQSGIDVTDCKIGIFNKGTISSGVLSVDVQAASGLDFASSVSIFTTEPSLNFSTASSYDESTNAVLSVSNKVLSEGDYIRIDITSIPVGLGRFFIYLTGEPS